MWEGARYEIEFETDNFWFFPIMYERPGHGAALDGKPKYDLNCFNQAYFDRLRDRVLAAAARGIYVIVPLFNGWSIASPKVEIAMLPSH